MNEPRRRLEEDVLFVSQLPGPDRDYFRFVYERRPIDWWAGACSFNAFLDEVERGQVMEWVARLRSAVYLLRRYTTWEGDGFFQVIPLFDGESERFDYALVVKQSNDGTTFVVSPQEIPVFDEEWLRAEAEKPRGLFSESGRKSLPKSVNG